MHHDRAYLRKVAKEHEKRRLKIIHDTMCWDVPKEKWGHYKKGKVHCGCWLCKPYKHNYYDKASVCRKKESQEEQIADLFVNDNL